MDKGSDVWKGCERLVFKADMAGTAKLRISVAGKGLVITVHCSETTNDSVFLIDLSEAEQPHAVIE